MKKIYLVVLNFLMFLLCNAQHTPAKQYLRPGNILPPLKLTGLRNSKINTLWLSQLYHNKPLVIAFWGTTCNTCLKSLPVLDSLQKQLSNGFNILSVTEDDPAEVKSLLAGNTTLRQLHQPYIAGDKLFARYFKYRYLPHIVWVSRGGRVCAITAEEEITAEHLRNFIATDSIDLFEKNDDMLFNAKQPYTPADTFITYRSLLTRFNPGIRAAEYAVTKEDSLGNIDSAQKIFLINTLPTNLFYKAFIHSVNTGYYDMVLYNRIIFNIKDSASCYYPLLSAQPIDKSWQRNALFSYEMITPMLSRQKFYSQMLDDLNRYFSIKATIEKRWMPCYVLNYDITGIKLQSAGGIKSLDYKYDSLSKQTVVTLSNYPLSGLTDLLNQFSINRPVFCAAALDIPVDLTVGLKTKTWFIQYDTESLKQELQRYGLKLEESEKELEVLVLSDK